jgi:glycosyltransferase involved in cell wall biosynthesis
VMNISIAMATFNGSHFIEQQLRTLSEQTVRPAELVIADDGSTDDTIPIAEHFARLAPFPVHIYRSAATKGYRQNFVDAASFCTSELIAFCDQDDIWHKEKLAEVRKHFLDSSVLLVHHNSRVVDRNGMPLGTLVPGGTHPPTSDPLTIDPRTFALGFSQVFRRSLLSFSHLRKQSLDFHFPEQRLELAHDQWFFFLASVLGRIVYVDQPLVDYRQHGGNLFGVESDKNLQPIVKLQQRFIKGANFFEHLASVANKLARILQAIAEDPGQPSRFRDAAAAGMAQYRRLAEWLELRTDAYRKPLLPDRLEIWLRLLRTEAYKSKAPWPFDKKSAMRDAVVGVLLGPR